MTHASTYLTKSPSARHFYSRATWELCSFNDIIARFNIRCKPGYQYKNDFIVPVIPTSEELQTRSKEDIIVFILTKIESDCELMEMCKKDTLIKYCAYMHRCLTYQKGIAPFQTWITQ